MIMHSEADLFSLSLSLTHTHSLKYKHTHTKTRTHALFVASLALSPAVFFPDFEKGWLAWWGQRWWLDKTPIIINELASAGEASGGEAYLHTLIIHTLAFVRRVREREKEWERKRSGQESDCKETEKVISERTETQLKVWTTSENRVKESREREQRERTVRVREWLKEWTVIMNERKKKRNRKRVTEDRERKEKEERDNM